MFHFFFGRCHRIEFLAQFNVYRCTAHSICLTDIGWMNLKWNSQIYKKNIYFAMTIQVKAIVIGKNTWKATCIFFIVFTIIVFFCCCVQKRFWRASSALSFYWNLLYIEKLKKCFLSAIQYSHSHLSKYQNKERKVSQWEPHNNNNNNCGIEVECPIFKLPHCFCSSMEATQGGRGNNRTLLMMASTIIHQRLLFFLILLFICFSGMLVAV